jgi:transposase-like protein
MASEREQNPWRRVMRDDCVSNEGPQCPYCGAQATADEGHYYEMTEFTCDDCGQTSDVLVDTTTTWATSARAASQKGE